MTHDPLSLHGAPTPFDYIIDRSAPSPKALAIFNRIVSNDFADSHETKTALIAHLVLETYLDLKRELTHE